MTALSVNLNKIALLRNARGEGLPDVSRAAHACIDAGADGITVHPRPDERHIRPDDVRILARLCRERSVEFNIEGNPFAGPRGSYPGFLSLVAEARPTQVTLVPDADAQLTSDHGFTPADAPRLAPLVRQLRDQGRRISLFVNPGETGLQALASIGADRVEIYTGPYARAFAAGNWRDAMAACVSTAQIARNVGLGVNAGHDLDQVNLPILRHAIPFLDEVSIGQALISDALYAGLAATVAAYLNALR